MRESRVAEMRIFSFKHLLRDLVLGVLMVLFCGLNAAAQDRHLGYYASLALGVPAPGTVEADDNLGRFNLDIDPGYAVAASVGVDLAANKTRGRGRVEVEYCYRSNGLNEVEFSDRSLSGNGDLVVQSLMLNSFAVVPTGRKLQPYFGLGVGAAQLKADGLTVGGRPLLDDDDLSFAWQLGAGFEMSLSQTLRLDLGYRYFSIFQPELKEADGRAVDIDYAAHTGMVGLVYLF